MQQLSGLDASFLYLETANAPMHVASVSIYDPSTAPGGRLTFTAILEHLERRLHLARAFRQKVVPVPMGLDHPYWIEDANFDLEYHVRHIALPPPGDWHQLCIQAARLHSRALDRSRPLWELYVIEGLDHIDGVPPGCFALVQKTHHAAVDGVSGLEMVSAIHTQTPIGEDPPVTDDWRPESEPSPWTLLSRATVANTMRPMHFARVMGRTIPALGRVQRQLGRRQLALPDANAPRTRFNNSVTTHRVVEACRFDLSEMRAVKSAVGGATINDGVLATIGGAMRRYLAAAGELPAASLLAMAPISVRTNEQRGAAGNQVSGMVVSLGTDIADPLSRLRAVVESTHRSKEFTSALGARTLTEYSQFIPGGLAALGARAASRFGVANRAAPIVNAVVTNVPGPQQPLYFAGARLVTIVGMGPVADGIGLIHPITSYCGELIVAATSCRELMPDPGFYASCIEESFTELVKATAPSVRASPPARRSSRRNAAARGASSAPKS